MRKIFNRKVLGIVALALVCVLAGTAIGSVRPAAEADTVVLTSPFTEAIAKVRDSVVGVYNYQLMNLYNNGYGNYGYDMFPWEFFGFGSGSGYGGNNGGRNGNNGSQQSTEVKYASGSGVVIAKEYVITNYHVVEDASSLKISVGGDDTNLYEATLAAKDPDKDVAVLYVPGLPLEPVEIGDSDQLQVGDWAINIGNAIGFTGTVTAGIISALDREIASDTTTTDRFGRKSAVMNTMIQTDAAINSGNSGGGMFNTAGELVGIPTLKYSGTRYSSGAIVESIGMCIPINEARDVIAEALSKNSSYMEQVQAEAQQEEVPEDKPEDAGETVTVTDRRGKPRLGVTVITVNGTKGFPNGAYVSSVDANSPAESAGIQAGDIIVEINGQVVGSTTDLMGGMEDMKEGDTVTLTVWRPNEVYSAENGMISSAGEYIENIQVGLALLDGVAQ